MLPPLLTISVEAVAGLLLIAPGLRTFLKQRGNRIRRAFLYATILLGASILIDALGRFLLYKPYVLTDAFFRASDAVGLVAGIALFYLGAVFPRRAGRRVRRPGDNRRSRLSTLLGILALAALPIAALVFSDDYYVENRFYNPISGAYYGEYQVGYWLTRVFFLSAILLGANEQRRFLRFHERDPRRVHARYYIYATLVMAALMILGGGLLLYRLENEFMAFRALVYLGFAVFVHNTLENLHLNYRTNILRSSLLFALYLALLLPLFYAINNLIIAMERIDPLLTALALSGLFVLFHLAARAAAPRITRLLFRKDARLDQAIADFNSSILQLHSSSRHEIRRQLAFFLEDLYQPRFLALYFPERGGEGEERPLQQDRSLTRVADLGSIPPDQFPSELLRFLIWQKRAAGEDGGLAADLLARAERRSDGAVTESLMGLAGAGAEIVLPFFSEERGVRRPERERAASPGAYRPEREDNDRGDRPQVELRPEAILVMGLLSEGRPLDHGDLNWLGLLRTPTLLALKNQELLLATTELKERLEEENQRITSRLTRNLQMEGLRPGPSGAAFIFQPGGKLSAVIEQAERFAVQDAPVLITGETGAGKGEIARLIHGISQRDGRFVTVNCSAIPGDLIENELFGHEKGAYTGAAEQSDGLVARAADGTLFFDEIGELPLEGQTKLLRLVQDGLYERIGAGESLRSTARFLFATNRDLEDEVKAGRFRKDLFFRISTFEVHAPPLRERREDIPLLVDHFLWMARQKFDRPRLSMTQAALELLQSYSWPGNVRELENLLLRMVVLNEGEELGVEQMPVMFRDGMDFDRKKNQLERVMQEQQRLEKELLLEALQRSDGNQREAARILNISRGSLQYRLKQYGMV